MPPAEPAGVRCVFEPCPQSDVSGAPTAVRIQAIDVESPLDVLTLDADNQLIPPTNFDHVGWYGDGVVPGEIGPAVLAGHVDALTGPAVFYDLSRLATGDVVEVQRGDTWIAFVVTTVEHYPKDEFPTDRVYQPTPTPELRLITCGGEFNRARGSYRDNIVVYAVAR
jgi:sortase (surface protein transpeptidase)